MITMNSRNKTAISVESLEGRLLQTALISPPHSLPAATAFLKFSPDDGVKGELPAATAFLKFSPDDWIKGGFSPDDVTGAGKIGIVSMSPWTPSGGHGGL
jgi:hypothetical protein